MIPKVIHYCWFGGNEMSALEKKCIESWKMQCPDYEIIRWDETNYDVTKNLYMQQAYAAKKWAFVSDYARLDILYQHGGFYLVYRCGSCSRAWMRSAPMRPLQASGAPAA